MIEKVTIYGDSFAAPRRYDPPEMDEETQRSERLREGRKREQAELKEEAEKENHPTWHGRLKERWPSTINLAVSGSGPMYSFKHFYQNLESYNYQDLIVFVLSGVNRLYFDVEEAHAWSSMIYHYATTPAVIRDTAGVVITSDPHIPIEGIDPKFQEWLDNNVDKARFAVDIFHDETVYGNWKYESLLYTASRIQKCKIFMWYLEPDESYIKTSLNDEYFHVHDEGLAEASWNEYVEEERLIHETSDDLYYRINHLSEVNHEIMYKQVTGFVDGREIPKFLKNVYRGTYKKDEFVYD